MIPFDVYEAVINLFPANADGSVSSASAMFWGGPANQLRMQKRNVGVMLAGSGDQYETNHQVDEKHQIQVGKVWLISEAAPSVDATFDRGGNYVMQITWQTEDRLRRFYWQQRTYYGVTVQDVDWSSNRPETLLNATFLAQRMIQTGGPGIYGVAGPSLPVLTQEQKLGFFREELLVSGYYLLGNYKYNVPAVATQAYADFWAGQGTDTILGLEVNGVLTGDTVTLPQNPTPNLDQNTGIVALARPILPGSSIRWKILSGPTDPELMALNCSVMMTLQVATI